MFLYDYTDTDTDTDSVPWSVKMRHPVATHNNADNVVLLCTQLKCVR